MDTQTIPRNAVVAAAIVLTYSFFCLSCGILLVVVLHRNKERYSYVILFAISTTCSTIFNIIQQLNYLANWHRLRREQYEASLAAYNKPSLALGPLSKGFNEALFWIVLYFYNVDSMLMLFWAVALVVTVWNWSPAKLRGQEHWMGGVSKVIAWILPAFIVGLRKSYQLALNFAPAVVLLNILMLTSFSVGTVCIGFILAKYLRTRLGISGSYATGTLPSGTPGAGVRHPGWRMRVDPWLILRFSMAFAILSALEVFLVCFEVTRYNRIQSTAEHQTAPDYSAGATITDVLNYIPGVTASLLAFLLFGTTGPLRKIYKSMFSTLNPFSTSERRSTILKPRLRASQRWSKMTEDVELSVARSEIMKGTSVDVSITEKGLAPSGAPVSAFDTQARVKHDAWYPGRRIGILDDP